MFMKYDMNDQQNLDPKLPSGIIVHIRSQTSHLLQAMQKFSLRKTHLGYNSASILSPLCHQSPLQDLAVQEWPLVMLMPVQNPFSLQEALALEEVYLGLCIFLVPCIQDALPIEEK